MKVYSPVYDNSRKVVELDSDLLRHMKGTRNAIYYKPNVGYYGTLYNMDTVFTSEEAAWRWWNHDRVLPEEYYKVKEVGE